MLFCSVNTRFNFSVVCEEQAAHPRWHYALEFWGFRCNLTKKKKTWKRTWCQFLLNFFALGCPIKVVLKAETVSEIRLNQLPFSLPEGRLYRFAESHLPLWFQAAYQTRAVKIEPLFFVSNSIALRFEATWQQPSNRSIPGIAFLDPAFLSTYVSPHCGHSDSIWTRLALQRVI